MHGTRGKEAGRYFLFLTHLRLCRQERGQQAEEDRKGREEDERRPGLETEKEDGRGAEESRGSSSEGFLDGFLNLEARGYGSLVPGTAVGGLLGSVNHPPGPLQALRTS